jgi:hypothetical protein
LFCINFTQVFHLFMLKLAQNSIRMFEQELFAFQEALLSISEI